MLPARLEQVQRLSGGPELACSQCPPLLVAGGAERLGPGLPETQPGVHAAQAVRVVELSGQHRRDGERQQLRPTLGGQPLEQLDHAAGTSVDQAW